MRGVVALLFSVGLASIAVQDLDDSIGRLGHTGTELDVFMTQMRGLFGPVCTPLAASVLGQFSFALSLYDLGSQTGDLHAWFDSLPGQAFRKWLHSVVRPSPFLTLWYRSSDQMVRAMLLWWIGKFEDSKVRTILDPNSLDGIFHTALFDFYRQPTEIANLGNAFCVLREWRLLRLASALPQAINIGAREVATHWYAAPRSDLILRLDLKNLRHPPRWDYHVMVGEEHQVTASLVTLQTSPLSLPCMLEFLAKIAQQNGLDPVLVQHFYRISLFFAGETPHMDVQSIMKHAEKNYLMEVFLKGVKRRLVA